MRLWWEFLHMLPNNYPTVSDIFFLLKRKLSKHWVRLKIVYFLWIKSPAYFIRRIVRPTSPPPLLFLGSFLSQLSLLLIWLQWGLRSLMNHFVRPPPPVPLGNYAVRTVQCSNPLQLQAPSLLFVTLPFAYFRENNWSLLMTSLLLIIFMFLPFFRVFSTWSMLSFRVSLFFCR